MKKAKLIGTIIGVFLFIALIAGFTYAWIAWQSNNINIADRSDCFDIDYGISQQIGSASAKASLSMTSDYTEGLSANVTLSLKTECANIPGTATLYLNTTNVGTTSGTSSGILNGALKYTVVSGTSVLANGVIDSNNKIPLVDNIDVSSTTPTTYTVYVWLDGEVADNSYANLNYIGYISAEAISK